MPAMRGEAAQVLGVSEKELEKQSLKALLEKELRSLRIEILSICQKYGVSSWKEMNCLAASYEVSTLEKNKMKQASGYLTQ